MRKIVSIVLMALIVVEASAEPFILQHGFAGVSKCWTDAKCGKSMMEMLEEDLDVTEIFLPDIGEETLNGLEHAAAVLESRLDEFYDYQDTVKPAIAIAHSMGGVIIKQLIQDEMNKKLPFPRVKALITMGTPHKGASLAVPAVLEAAGGLVSGVLGFHTAALLSAAAAGILSLPVLSEFLSPDLSTLLTGGAGGAGIILLSYVAQTALEELTAPDSQAAKDLAPGSDILDKIYLPASEKVSYGTIYGEENTFWAVAEDYIDPLFKYPDAFEKFKEMVLCMIGTLNILEPDKIDDKALKASMLYISSINDNYWFFTAGFAVIGVTLILLSWISPAFAFVGMFFLIAGIETCSPVDDWPSIVNANPDVFGSNRSGDSIIPVGSQMLNWPESKKESKRWLENRKAHYFNHAEEYWPEEDEGRTDEERKSVEKGIKAAVYRIRDWHPYIKITSIKNGGTLKLQMQGKKVVAPIGFKVRKGSEELNRASPIDSLYFYYRRKGETKWHEFRRSMTVNSRKPVSKTYYWNVTDMKPGRYDIILAVNAKDPDGKVWDWEMVEDVYVPLLCVHKCEWKWSNISNILDISVDFTTRADKTYIKYKDLSGVWHYVKTFKGNAKYEYTFPAELRSSHSGWIVIRFIAEKDGTTQVVEKKFYVKIIPRLDPVKSQPLPISESPLK
ncbi:MAG: hypothetical protein J7L52_02960 [Thermotogae bacterium]|nr:hypothetical protein [Thermotogota bacterium]